MHIGPRTGLITLHIFEYRGNDNDMRSATIDFTVFKDNKTTKGHIFVHQYALKSKIDF